MKTNFNNNSKIRHGNYLFQYLCTITGTLSVFSSTMHYAWPTPSLPKLLGNSSHMSVTDSEGSWMAVLFLLGCPVGSVVTFLTVDVLGRKKILLLTTIPFISSWIMIAYATFVEVLYAARFIAGIADGIVYTVIPIYICEIADPKIRGFLGSTASITNMMGILLVNVLGIFLSIKTAALVSLSLPIIFLLTFSWMPESPYFLIMRNQYELAKDSLRMLNGKIDLESNFNRLVKAVKSNDLQNGGLLNLFKVRSNKRSIIIVIGLRTCQQLSGYTAITFYAQIMFESVSNILPANVSTLIYFFIQCIVTIISALLLDRAGRKPLLVVSTIGCILSLVIQATYYYLNIKMDLSHLSIIPGLSLIMFVIFYSLGMSTIPTLMLGELFPTNVKAFALCLTEIYYGLIATVASKFFQIIKDNFGLFIPLYAFAGCCLIGLVFVVQYVPETKGKTLEEIHDELGKQTNTSRDHQHPRGTENL